MIATTHLEPYINRRASNLSAAWRQRLPWLARSLHRRPCSLMSDSGIDPSRVASSGLLFEFAGKHDLFVTTHTWMKRSAAIIVLH